MRFKTKWAGPKDIANNRPKPKRPYAPVSITTLNQLVKLNGYIHSNLDNFNKSYKDLQYTKVSGIKEMKKDLIQANRDACKKLEDQRTKLEKSLSDPASGFKFTRQTIQDKLKDPDDTKSFLAADTAIHALFKKEKGKKQEWSLEQIKQLAKELDNIIGLYNQKPLQPYRDNGYNSTITKLNEIRNKINTIVKRTGNSTVLDPALLKEVYKEGGKQETGVWIVTQTIQALGTSLEPMMAVALAKIFQGADVKAIGGFQRLEDISIDFKLHTSGIEAFGANVKSSATEYINQTETHTVNPASFWGSDYATDYLPQAALLDYAFWNMVSLKQYSVSSKERLRMQPVKAEQKDFLIDVSSIYQLSYLYSVMVTHAKEAPNQIPKGQQFSIKGATTAAKDQIPNYYIILKDNVFNTDEVYTQMINLYEGTHGETANQIWANAQKWIKGATTPAQTTLKALHEAKKRRIQDLATDKDSARKPYKPKKNKPFTRKNYITYQSLRDDPEIGSIIEDIYNQWNLSRNLHIIKYKVNLNKLMSSSVEDTTK